MVNKVILGTVQFGLDYGVNNINGIPSDAGISEILDLAFEKGIRYLDTAEAYGDSQNRIGKYHRTSSNKFNVITKFSSKERSLPNDIEQRIISNLNILNIQSLYCYMYHSFKDFELYFGLHQKSLLRLKSKGKIKKIGVSVYSNKELEKVLDFKDIDLIQLPFNLLDNNQLRSDALCKAKIMGVEIHSRSVFLQGLFFKSISDISSNLYKLSPYLDKINQLKIKWNLTTEEIALKYVLNKSYIDNVLIGVDSPTQLLSNLSAICRDSLIPHEEIDNILVLEQELLSPVNW